MNEKTADRSASIAPDSAVPNAIRSSGAEGAARPVNDNHLSRDQRVVKLDLVHDPLADRRLVLPQPRDDVPGPASAGAG
ncbi:hypothetical protein [Paraburkholderia sp. BL17N1]|uniref:hypothetical protein n=1 Tax=Paraburkholderia sp. BL17N1 TaxID=1938798 RepID=UPI000F1FF1C1|nr:hypothetical protein [Paraburkholderia sp. BL17N1]RKR31146.1 hypothetical protein B0G82_7270 [Paraburkholderia sp. BL17N1]